MKIFIAIGLALCVAAAQVPDDGDHDHGFSFHHLASHVNSTAPVTGDGIDVWITPHTHDDTGWLETVDQYYVNEVQFILSTLEPALARSREGFPQRKFSYVEIGGA
jgi:hypothetical protein